MTRPIVLITEPIAQAPLDWISARADVRLLNQSDPSDDDLSAAHALVVRTYTRVDSALLDRAPGLRVIARAGVGLDNIDLGACRARGIPVVHTPTANAGAVVEYVMSMMLNTLRPITSLSEPIDPGGWGQTRDQQVTPRTSVGASLGIIGFGQIGSRVGRVASAMQMNVRYNDLREIPAHAREGATPSDLESLACESGVISIHVDGRASNAQFFGPSFFAMLRPDVVLINASRGFAVDTDAAIEFARTNPGAQLVLDVHDPEPIPLDSPLWSLKNVILTPHIAAGTRAAKEAMSWVVRDVIRVLSGEEPENAYDGS
jgi:phosphoglycerate dehydrogenase-like enzyme